MMFGKTAFMLKTLLIWCLFTAILTESVRHKKDVHHMIFINERRPSKNFRNKNHAHSEVYSEDGPSKSRRKPGGAKHKEPVISDDSIEGNSYEEYRRHKPKPKRHHNKHTHNPGYDHKRHNNQRHHKDRKEHHKDNHHNHGPTNFPSGNWIPMSSKELFGKDQHHFKKGNSEGPQNGGLAFSQPIPLEITTHLPYQPVDSYQQFQSTLYPPLSPSYHQYINQNTPPSPLIGTVEPYKPFDYSILEQKPQSQQLSPSNLVNVQQSGANLGTPFSIIVENSHENFENKEVAQVGKEERKQADSGKREKKKRGRGGSRYRRTKY